MKNEQSSNTMQWVVKRAKNLTRFETFRGAYVFWCSCPGAKFPCQPEV